MRNVYKSICAAFAFTGFVCPSAIAADKTLSFYSSGKELRPFYWEENGQQKGIVLDILSRALPNYKIKLLQAPRKRIDQFIEDGRIDVAMLHPKYTKMDESLFFIPLHFFQQNVLFTLEKNRHAHRYIDGLRDESVCARDGYVYINMKGRWDAQLLRRENLKSNLALLQMLQAGRCDYAIGSDLSLRYLIKQQNMTGIKRTNVVVNKVPRFIALSKRHPDLQEKITNTIDYMKATGELNKLIKSYAP